LVERKKECRSSPGEGSPFSGRGEKKTWGGFLPEEGEFPNRGRGKEKKNRVKKRRPRGEGRERKTLPCIDRGKEKGGQLGKRFVLAEKKERKRSLREGGNKKAPGLEKGGKEGNP